MAQVQAAGAQLAAMGVKHSTVQGQDVQKAITPAMKYGSTAPPPPARGRSLS